MKPVFHAIGSRVAETGRFQAMGGKLDSTAVQPRLGPLDGYPAVVDELLEGQAHGVGDDDGDAPSCSVPGTLRANSQRRIHMR